VFKAYKDKSKFKLYMQNYNLPVLSNEQEYSINKVKENNIIIDSVAGSGKTTTTLHIAKLYYDKKILLLTYNARLKIETREKKEKLGLNNLEVHSYHSYNKNIYGSSNYTDIGIVNTIKNQNLIIGDKQYDVVILDEAQDITMTYYEFACKIIKDTCKLHNINLVILGDKNQAIFDFNNADNRFIKNADTIFNFNEKPWELTTLSTSYRITNQMSQFVNNRMLKEHRLNAIKNGRLVKYMVIDVYNQYHQLYLWKQIEWCLCNGYTESDIFILAPSVRSKHSPIRKFGNYISLIKHKNIYVSSNDNEALNDKLLNKKIVLATFHQVKGLERKVVIVTSFDNAYFKYYSHNKSDVCPNELYVACTRASEILIVVQNIKSDILPFFNYTNLQQDVNTCYFSIKNSNALIKSKYINNIEINCIDYLKDDIKEVFDMCNNLKYIKYATVCNIKKIKYIQIISYLLYLLKSYNKDDIKILIYYPTLNKFGKDDELLRHMIANKISPTICSNKFDNKTQIVLYYVYSNNYNTYFDSYDTFYVKNNNIISSFKISYGNQLNFTECCNIITNAINYKHSKKDDIGNSNENIRVLTVTEICKYIPTSLIMEILNDIKYTKVQNEEKSKIIRSTLLCGNDRMESVATINGIMIPSLFEYLTSGKMNMFKNIEDQVQIINIKLYNDLKNRKQKNNSITKIINIFSNEIIGANINNMMKLKSVQQLLFKYDNIYVKMLDYVFEIIPLMNEFKSHYGLIKLAFENNDLKINEYVEKLLKICNFNNCLDTGYFHTMRQIYKYNWLTLADINMLMKRLESKISNDCIFESNIFACDALYKIQKEDTELNNILLAGRIDCFDRKSNILWEFKCAQKLDHSYLIQLAIYSYLFYRYTAFVNNKKSLEMRDNPQYISKIFYTDNNRLKHANKEDMHLVKNNIYECKLNTLHENQIVYDDKVKNKYIPYWNEYVPKFYLFNLFTNEIIEINFNYDKLKNMIGKLIQHKQSNNGKINDDEFMKLVNDIKYKYFPLS